MDITTIFESQNPRTSPAKKFLFERNDNLFEIQTVLVWLWHC